MYVYIVHVHIHVHVCTSLYMYLHVCMHDHACIDLSKYHFKGNHKRILSVYLSLTCVDTLALLMQFAHASHMCAQVLY